MEWREAAAGAVFEGYRVTSNRDIPEINCRLIELLHEETGAVVMKVVNDDSENLFCLSLQTLPESSNGVAHVLEHTVLCGSKKFPVHDPFFCMARRSLNTYMNALTGSDFTCYPAATQIEKDFYNLLEVYIDAVFFPDLNPLSFMQEGHRLGFQKEGDVDTKLLYKGIVFNEMKGALSSPNSRLQEVINAQLLPDTTYGVNSGGDPKEIPKLTHRELIDFHEKHYHPSRALFFFYGSFPLEKQLRFLSEKLLKGCSRKEPLPPMARQPRFKEPVRVEAPCPLTDEEGQGDKSIVAFSWLTATVLEQEELLALSIIDSALMESDASPLKKALIKSGLCTQATSYLDSDLYDVPFVLTLKGCRKEDADEIERLLFSTLRQIAQEGIREKYVDSALHLLEFDRSEISGGSSPYGLTLFFRAALMKHHGADPIEGLVIHTLFDRLRKRIDSDPRYLEKLIDKHLVENPHFVRVTMVPDGELIERESLEEEAALKEVRSGLSQGDLLKIAEKERELADFQAKQESEDPDILPKLTLGEIPKESVSYPLSHCREGGLDVYHHGAFTNSILTTDLVFELPRVEESEVWLFRFYATLLSEMGFGGRSYEENLEYIQENLGGFSASLAINIKASDGEAYTPTFNLRGKALYRKSRELFTLLKGAAQAVEFGDRARLKELFFKHYTALNSSLTQSSMRYALNLAASGINEASKLNHIWGGIEYYRAIREIAKNYDREEGALVEKLLSMNEGMKKLSRPHLVIGCDGNHFNALKNERFFGLAELPIEEGGGKFSLSSPSPIASHAKVIASPIAFNCKVFRTPPYTSGEAPALSIIANLFDHLTLHRLLREQGGAYGGGASYNSQSGIFSFYSYRDPNISLTMQAFNKAVDKVVKGDFDQFAIEQAIFEKIQALDTPVSPGNRARVAHSWLLEGKTDAMRQQFRERLLTLTKEEIVEVAERVIAPNLCNGTTIVFAGEELLERENSEFEQQGLPLLQLQRI